MKNQEVALAVITYYPKWYQGKLRSIKDTDKVRGDLALGFFQKAAKLGYSIVVADGMSSRSFRLELKKNSGLNIFNRRSKSALSAKKMAIKQTANLPGVKVIILSEAEKVGLIEFIPNLVRPILKGEADMVIPERQVKLFEKTYPAFMFESETEGNRLVNIILRQNNLWGGKDLDLFFGPRVFANKKSIVDLFMRDYSFARSSHSIQFLPVVSALTNNLRVRGVKIPFQYPKKQRLNEEKGQRKVFEKKRSDQKKEILEELLYFLHSDHLRLTTNKINGKFSSNNG